MRTGERVHAEQRLALSFGPQRQEDAETVVCRALAPGGFRQSGRDRPPGGVGEERLQRQPPSGAFGQHRHQSGGDERLSAEVEEVVVDFDALGFEQLLEDVDDHPFERSGRRDVLLTGAELRFGQRRPVDLPAPVSGISAMGTIAAGTMWAGSVSPTKAASADGPDGASTAPGTRPAPSPRGAGGAEDGREVDVGMRQQRRLDLTELDAEAADLHLEVDRPRKSIPSRRPCAATP